MALFGVIGGARAIGDNSTFVHLRTGIETFASGVPSADSYSFTALGEPFVVQSWLMSFLYGAGYEVTGDFRVAVVLHGLLMGAAAYLTARLVRTDRVATSAGFASVVVVSGAMWWSSRPLLAGIVAFAVAVSLTVAGRRPMWMVLVAVVWIACHGSWPIGLGWLLLVGVGRALDTRRIHRDDVLRVAAFAVGVCLGALSPVGIRIVTFPLVPFQRRDVFANIVEWGSPSFSGAPAVLSLVAFAVGTGLVLRRRAPWAYTLPYVVLLAAGLVSLRNLPMASVALAAALAPVAQAARTTTVGSGPMRPPKPIAAALIAACVAWLAIAQGGPDLALSTYPYAELRALEDAGIVDGGTRLLLPETGGCLQILRKAIEPPERAQLVPLVFVDDRFDTYPVAVLDDYRALVFGSEDPGPILDAYGIDVIVWQSGAPLTRILSASPSWQQVELRLDPKLPGSKPGEFVAFERSSS